MRDSLIYFPEKVFFTTIDDRRNLTGEITMAAGDKHNKITTGFVIQNYEEQEDGKLVCSGQEFVAADQVDYENEAGEPVHIDTSKEVCQPLDMAQPGRDYYVIGMMGCVEPVLHGPFETDDEQQQCIDKLRTEEGEDVNTFSVMNVSKGAKITL